MSIIKEFKIWIGKSLRNKLMIIILIFTTFPLLFFALLYYNNLWSSAIKESSYNARMSIDKCAELINREFLNYSQKSDYITTNNSLFKNIERNFGTNLNNKVIFYNEVNVFLDKVLLLDSYRKDIFSIYISNTSLYENNYFKFVENSQNKTFIQDVVIKSKTFKGIWRPEIFTENNGNQYICIYRNLLPESQDIAVLETKIPFSNILFYMKNINLPKDSLLALRDAAGKDIYIDISASGDEVKLPEKIDYNDYLIFESTLINSYKLVGMISKGAISKNVIRSFGVIFFLIFIAIICIALASTLTLKRVIKSLNEFITTIKNETTGILNHNEITISNLSENDEIGLIKERFKKLVDTIQCLHDENLEAFKKGSDLEMELLQSKINPHLLYNSLSVIKWMAQRKADEHMVKMVDSMTRYYRRVLNKGNNTLKLREELEMIKEYVNIMNYNHASEYQLDIQVDQDLLDLRTIKLIFQPLVENSIMHGLNGKEGEKRIIIRGTRKDGYIRFVVEDNGHGIDKERLERLVNLQYESEFGGYGIRNLINRVRNFYGNKVIFLIESEKGKYTRMILNLPEIIKE